MATECILRVESLRILLDLTQHQFIDRIGLKSRSTYSNWRRGPQEPDRDTLIRIADRWQVDYDSLWGRNGITEIEPSPALARAQDLITTALAVKDTPGRPTDRLLLIWKKLHEYVPDMPFEGWLDWIHWSEQDWNAASSVKKHEASNHQLRGAAFLLGWHSGYEMWNEWFHSGLGSALSDGTEAEAVRIGRLVQSMGLDWIEVRRRLSNKK